MIQHEGIDMTKKSICVYVGNRAQYTSLKPIMHEIKRHQDLELQLILSASAVIEKFGNLIKQITQDGFNIDFQFNSLIEGETTVTMAQSSGLGMIEVAMVFDKIKPDLVLVVGDRFEILPVVMSAVYMNITVAHTMGGEVTGTIDESIRHAVTKLAHIHFPANSDAETRILKLGEDPKYVFNVGCPRIDLIRSTLNQDSKSYIKNNWHKFIGVGTEIDFDSQFLLASQHAVTTEYENQKEDIFETLEALHETGLQCICLWPNADAGSNLISAGIRSFRERQINSKFHFIKNLPPEFYTHLLNLTTCLVGNSSSGIRDAAYIGTPVVNIGSRQNRRQSGENVLHAKNCREAILKQIYAQLSHGNYQSSHLYGDGFASQKIANILSDCNPATQKVITY